MPSRSEPCGLAQMVSCRYGTIPVIRETGGLKDSIHDSGDGYGNGFTFANYNAHELNGGLLARQGRLLAEGRLARAGQARHGCDFSWSNSAKSYEGCTTRSSTSGNLFIKCGLSSKSGGPHFSLKKAAFFSKNRLTFPSCQPL